MAQPQLQTSASAAIPAVRKRCLSIDELDAMLAEEPKTLYVNRPLKNADDIIAWARAQGFTKTLAPDDIHVTVAFSKRPLAWPQADDEDVHLDAGGPRSVAKMGEQGAIALKFKCDQLQKRWEQLKNAGASWDYSSYQPHITFTMADGDVDLSGIEPYDGPLEFGPEAFDEIGKRGEDWAAKAKASLVGDAVIKNQDFKVRGDLVALDSALTLALDRESARDYDRDGRMRVATANISKANVCPYKGHEIPDWQKLGLDPNKVYQLLRDPEELAKAAPTFNGVQILRKHTPVSVDDHQPWEVVGSTGTDASFADPYLTNSLNIWTREGRDGIESGRQRELSCGYHYRADMTPGNFNGTAYDGVMRDIVGNHVALVEDGRAGPDVLVGDSNQEIAEMSTRDLAQKIAAVSARTTSFAALHTYLRPRLAKDAKISLAMAFDSVPVGPKFKANISKIATSIRTQAKGKMATDTSLDDVEQVLGMLEKHEVSSDESETEISPAEGKAIETATNAIAEIEPPKPADDATEGLRGFLKEKGMGEDDINTACGMMKKTAGDEFPPKESDEEKEKKRKEQEAKDASMKDMVTKPAMDAAVKLATDSAIKTVRDTERGIRIALTTVRPWVGELAPTLALDSAADVYRHALKMIGIDGADKLHADALLPVLQAQPQPGAKSRSGETVLAADAATVKGFNERFPGAQRIGSV